MKNTMLERENECGSIKSMGDPSEDYDLTHCCYIMAEEKITKDWDKQGKSSMQFI